MKAIRTTLCAVAMVLAGCRTELALSPDANVLDVPDARSRTEVPEDLATLDTLVRYWGHELSTDLFSELAPIARTAGGLSGNELVSALERSGFEAFLFNGALDGSELSLYHHLDRGRPLIVRLLEGAVVRQALLVGHDPREQRFVLDDGRGHRAVVGRADFERAWEGAERFTLLALPLERD